MNCFTLEIQLILKITGIKKFFKKLIEIDMSPTCHSNGPKSLRNNLSLPELSPIFAINVVMYLFPIRVHLKSLRNHSKEQHNA